VTVCVEASESDRSRFQFDSKMQWAEPSSFVGAEALETGSYRISLGFVQTTGQT
jgi:hypothetical protein